MDLYQKKISWYGAEDDKKCFMYKLIIHKFQNS